MSWWISLVINCIFEGAVSCGSISQVSAISCHENQWPFHAETFKTLTCSHQLETPSLAYNEQHISSAYFELQQDALWLILFFQLLSLSILVPTISSHKPLPNISGIYTSFRTKIFLWMITTSEDASCDIPHRLGRMLLVSWGISFGWLILILFCRL